MGRHRRVLHSRYFIRVFLVVLFALGTPVVASAEATSDLRPGMPVPFAPPEVDYPIPSGHFYTQTGDGSGGFGVRDLSGVRLWSEYQRYGGPDALGYPISRPFWGPGGFLYQAFQRALLQWRPELDAAVLANGMEIIEWHEPTHDDWLFTSHSIPYPQRPRQGGFVEEAFERMSWLSNEDIRTAFLSNPVNGQPWEAEAAINYYGLPQSEPVSFGPFIVQRFQRIPLQLWTEPVPGMPPPGSVVGVLSGELVKECGAIPEDATVPEPFLAPLPADSRPNPAPAPSAASGPTGETYVVQPGDNLYRIASRLYGNFAAWQLIYDANRDRIASPDRIQAGMELRIP